jgi:hypothetical protein
MPEFTPPYAFTFDPPATTSGRPTVINRGFAPRGFRDFVLQSDHDRPSTADLITSFGVDAGVAGDIWNMPGVPAERLAVTAWFDFGSLIFADGVLASAAAGDWTSIYAEEFDRPGGRFLGSRQSPDNVFRREDHWYVSGNDEWPDALTSAVQSWEMPIVHGHFYRVWFDVHGSLHAAGWGGIGGSGARVQLFVHLNMLDVFFVGR